LQSGGATRLQQGPELEGERDGIYDIPVDIFKHSDQTHTKSHSRQKKKPKKKRRRRRKGRGGEKVKINERCRDGEKKTEKAAVLASG
jgi:hypothetical protein